MTKTYIRVALFATMIVLMALMQSCLTFRMSKKEIRSYFQQRGIQGMQHEYKVSFRSIHYIQSGDETKPLILFLHGSPGSRSAFIDFLADSTLLNHALLISADRPGFGNSNFGNAEVSLQKQGEFLLPIIEKHKHNKPVILVGHSLGGPLIARMAMDYPHLIDGLIIVSGSIDPGLEPNETWFRAPLATPFLSWLLPKAMRASNEEIYKLKPQLEKMLPHWNKITCPTVVIHGNKDSLVPVENVAFAKKMLVSAPVEYLLKDDMNHFVPWSNPELIRKAILLLLHKNSLRTSEVR